MQRKRLKRLFDHACPKDSPLQYDACCMLLSSFLFFLPLSPLYTLPLLPTPSPLTPFPSPFPPPSFSCSLSSLLLTSSPLPCLSPFLTPLHLPHCVFLLCFLSLLPFPPSLSLLSFYFLALHPLSRSSRSSFLLPFLLRLEATLFLT